MKSPSTIGPRAALTVLTVCCFLSFRSNVAAAEPDADVQAGHSYHGEAFNEGPRQSAYLMPGMGNVEFPASTERKLAQRFINQGVAQLHGFWYYEAERSFRQAAVLDPDCAIAYWGMAMANSGNLERARDFIAEAVDRIDSTTEREKLYIKAYEKFCQEEDDKGEKIEKKERAKKYTLELEEIVEEYPDDVEAKAFLALQCWQNARADLPIVSYVAVNSILQDVFDENPNHPAHHYRIHLWDRHKAKRALESAANCGQSLPGIAHMWHMPGHIYDKLHRYHDAVWQQEASARVDHSHMMRDRVLPDQIHNFAHNNEWLIRNLVKIGRVEDALSLARNMLELPRHPKYNVVTKRGSTKYGRERLLLVLNSYRLWPELIEFADTMYLEPTSEDKLQITRIGHLGFALAMEASEELADVREDLTTRLDANEATLKELEEQAKLDKAAEKKGEAEGDSKKAKANRKRRKKERDGTSKKLKDLNKEIKKALKKIEVGELAAEGKWEEALKGWKDSGLNDNLLKAEWQMEAGKAEEAMKLIESEIDDKPGQLLPLACKAFLQFQSEGAEAAQTTFEQVRVLASQADLGTPLLARLAPLAAELGLDEKWSTEFKIADDTGKRPDLDSLGPFRWHPYLAPDFQVTAADDTSVRLRDVAAKPTLVIFYLGFGCLHCVEQLHEFSPRAEEFRSSGIELMAISTENVDSLNEALKDYSKPLEIPLHADPELNAFKAYRCFDDFENQPLHGTFLIAPDGRVLWQDISYEPFMDVDFALKESHRLLNLAGFAEQLTKPLPKKSFVPETQTIGE